MIWVSRQIGRSLFDPISSSVMQMARKRQCQQKLMELDDDDDKSVSANCRRILSLFFIDRSANSTHIIVIYARRMFDVVFFQQGSYGVVKLAYSQEDDTHYVSPHNILLLNDTQKATLFFSRHQKARFMRNIH